MFKVTDDHSVLEDKRVAGLWMFVDVRPEQLA